MSTYQPIIENRKGLLATSAENRIQLQKIPYTTSHRGNQLTQEGSHTYEELNFDVKCLTVQQLSNCLFFFFFLADLSTSFLNVPFYNEKKLNSKKHKVSCISSLWKKSTGKLFENQYYRSRFSYSAAYQEATKIWIALSNTILGSCLCDNKNPLKSKLSAHLI